MTMINAIVKLTHSRSSRCHFHSHLLSNFSPMFLSRFIKDTIKLIKL